MFSKLLNAAGWFAAGYALSRAIEARAAGVPMSVAFQPNASLLLSVTRLKALAQQTTPASRQLAPYDPDAPLPFAN